jgi:ankyrin repeat protein
VSAPTEVTATSAFISHPLWTQYLRYRQGTTSTYQDDIPSAKDKGGAEYDPTRQSEAFQQYRTVLETCLRNEVPFSTDELGVSNDTIDRFRARHASGAYPCHYRGCSWSFGGFDTAEARNIHQQVHVQNLVCTQDSCGLRMRSKRALRNHQRKYHTKANDLALPPFVLKASKAQRAEGRSLSGSSTDDESQTLIQSPILAGKRRRRSSDILPQNDGSDSTTAPLSSPILTLSRSTSVLSSPDPTGSHTQRKWRDRNGRTFLSRACSQADFDRVRMCLRERPLDLDSPDNAGNTPLQIASLEGFADIVQFLLRNGAEVDTRNIDKDTPLIDAVENGHVEVVKLLLQHGANPGLPNACGDEPYMLVPSDDENYDAITQLLAESSRIRAKQLASPNHDRSPNKQSPLGQPEGYVFPPALGEFNTDSLDIDDYLRQAQEEAKRRSIHEQMRQMQQQLTASSSENARSTTDHAQLRPVETTTDRAVRLALANYERTGGLSEVDSRPDTGEG